MSTSPLPMTTAVIVTHNGARWIGRCVASLQGEPLQRIIVVDNASWDDTQRLVTSAGTRTDLIPLDENVGFGRANNRGIQAALDGGAEFVALFNQDLTVEPGAVERLVRALAARPRLAMVSALQLSYDGNSIDKRFRDCLPPLFWDDLLLRLPDEIYEAEFVPAAAVVIRRQALLEIGGFDPLFFMYGEDVDLCRRTRSRGWHVGVAPAARVRHWHTAGHVTDMSEWDTNRYFSLAVRTLKWGPLPPSVEALRLAWRWFGPRMGRAALRQLLALIRCAPLLTRIERQRRTIPFRFEDRNEAVGPAAPQGGTVATAHLRVTGGA